MFQGSNHKWIISALVFVYICIQVYCIQQLSVNYDEGLFARYGTSILKRQGEKDPVVFDSQLPITAVNMLPRAIEQLMHPGLTRPSAELDIIRGRYISLLAAVVLALTVYRWSALLYGSNTGLFSLIIFLICPNFLAHGIFLSPDIFASLFITLALFFLWTFSRTIRRRHFLLASLFTALAQISKYSMVHLLILVPILLVIWYLYNRDRLRAQAFTFRSLLYQLFFFAGINWLVISAAHLCYGMFIPLNEYHFRSTAFQHLQQLLHGVPVPLPSGYIKSMDMVIYLDRLGAGTANSSQAAFYVAGKTSLHGFWYYYFVVLLYKLPLPLLIILAITSIVYCSKINWQAFAQKELYLILPAVYFFVYMSFFYSTQIGIRHIIIVFPLLYVFAGCCVQQASAPAVKYFFYTMLAWQCISVGRYFPHFLPYTNELVVNKKMAYKKLADSNLCYGEGRKYLLQYLQANPQAKYLPAIITPGTVVMEVNEMLGLDIATAGRYNWVKGLEPSDHIHSQYLVFNISKAVADSLQTVHR